MNEHVKPVYLEEKLEEIRADGHLEYRSKSLPTWCPGCGYFSMAEGLTAALNSLGIAEKDTVVVSGIGCSSRFPFFVNTYGFHTLHGRVLPVSTGVKVGNDALTVIAVGGDGDAFAIGSGHIPHAARRNVNITYLVFDNGVYGLTKGQTSPTTALGFRSSTTPYENGDQPLNPMMMLLGFGASWVGQAYAGHHRHLADMITQAISHKGFSFLRVLSPCVTFDKTDNTYANLNMNVRYLPDNHDTSDLMAAMAEAQKSAHPALGVYYKEDRATLGEVMNHTIEMARERSGG